MEIAFIILTVITLGTALMVVLAKNLVRAAVALIFCFFGVAGFYVLLDAEFVAAAQVLIYVGGITVLLLFAIMLTFRISNRGLKIYNEMKGVSFLVAASLLLVLLTLLWQGRWAQNPAPVQAKTTAAIGKLLMTTYVLPFEVASVLLLIGLVGAIILARKEK
jgi:NADH:ubiquinone oxidoreductase subunit 6 (subunit J)